MDKKELDRIATMLEEKRKIAKQKQNILLAELEKKGE